MEQTEQIGTIKIMEPVDYEEDVEASESLQFTIELLNGKEILIKTPMDVDHLNYMIGETIIIKTSKIKNRGVIVLERCLEHRPSEQKVLQKSLY